MQLNITTDYAVRVILMLSEPGRMAPASEIARTLVIPINYLMKVLTKLKTAGLVSASLGVKGGYSLAMPAEEITFQMVFDVMGDSVKINRCLEPDHFCSRRATETCPVRAFYVGIQDYLDDQFANTSIVGVIEKAAKKAIKSGE